MDKFYERNYLSAIYSQSGVKNAIHSQSCSGGRPLAQIPLSRTQNSQLLTTDQKKYCTMVQLNRKIRLQFFLKMDKFHSGNYLSAMYSWSGVKNAIHSQSCSERRQTSSSDPVVQNLELHQTGNFISRTTLTPKAQTTHYRMRKKFPQFLLMQ